MIDFKKFSQAEFDSFKELAQKVFEKSPMERDFYLFDQKSEASAKIYCFGVRALINVFNCTENSDLKAEIEREIKANEATFKSISDLLNLIDKANLFQKIRIRKLFHLTHKKEVLEVIDLVGLLVEKTRLIDTSLFRGVLYEGKSKEAFDKINQEFEHV